MSVYRVLDRHNYRDHPPGTVFEAHLEPGAEARAIRFGVIELLERIEPGLRPGSWTLPAGWNPNESEQED